jgi:hypothetical protein
MQLHGDDAKTDGAPGKTIDTSKMTDDFEDRLKATADQIRAERKRQQDEYERRVQQQQTVVATMSEAIREWEE